MSQYLICQDDTFPQMLWYTELRHSAADKIVLSIQLRERKLAQSLSHKDEVKAYVNPFGNACYCCDFFLIMRLERWNEINNDNKKTRFFIIDFLSSVHGIDNAELKKQRIETRLKNARLFVMHPLHCLQSRI